MTISELREKRTKLWNQAQAFLDTRRVDGNSRQAGVHIAVCTGD